MEYIKFWSEVAVHVIVLFIFVGIIFSFTAGVIGFIVWLWDRIKEEKSGFRDWK